jgi:hypothetical protein
MPQERLRTGWSAAVAAWLLFGAAALAPLPFGSTSPPAIAFWCIVLGVCLVFAPVRLLGAGQLGLVALAGGSVAALQHGGVLNDRLNNVTRVAVADVHALARGFEAEEGGIRAAQFL